MPDHPGVDIQCLARDKTGFFGTKKHRRVGDVARVAAPLDGLMFEHEARIAFRIGVDFFRVCSQSVGRHGIDGDAVFTEFPNQGPRQADQRGLRLT